MDITELDLGFGWTKARRNNSLFCQPSVVGEGKRLHDENRKDGYLIFEKYFIGELALKHSDVKYYSLNDNKATTWTTEILMKTALAYLKTSNTNVVTGLPVDFYFNQKEDFESLLEKVKSQNVCLEEIGKGKRQENISINQYKIVPQPLGAAMDYLLDKNGGIERREDAKRRLLVIDWGRYTLDLLILDGMEIHKASSSPPNLGIDAAYKILRRYLRDHIGSSPATYDMDNIVKSGEYEGVDITPLVDAAFSAVTQQIQLEVEGLNMHFHKYLLAGGQTERLNNYLDIPDKIVGNQLSNINGYGKIGRRTWQ